MIDDCNIHFVKKSQDCIRWDSGAEGMGGRRHNKQGRGTDIENASSYKARTKHKTYFSSNMSSR